MKRKYQHKWNLKCNKTLHWERTATKKEKEKAQHLVVTFLKNMAKTRLWLCGTIATDSQFMSWFDAFIVPSAFNWLVVRPGSQGTMGSRKQNRKTLCHCDVKMLLCVRSENHSGWLIDLSGKRNFHSKRSSVLFPNFNKLVCVVTYWGLCTSLPGRLHPLSGW